MLENKNIYKHDPITITNFQIKTLDIAAAELLSMVEEIAKEGEISIEEIEELKKIIQKVYTKKKASYFIEEKIGGFIEYLGDACSLALKSSNKIHDNEYTELTYLNHTRRLLTNEY